MSLHHVPGWLPENFCETKKKTLWDDYHSYRGLGGDDKQLNSPSSPPIANAANPTEAKRGETLPEVGHQSRKGRSLQFQFRFDQLNHVADCFREADLEITDLDLEAVF